ncbi:hypothetical protein V6N12_010428 [Hibiscus sabdariffa]|uniref:SOSEKI DIX-like domain-containing protein n=1 Tax=Hibiscus sabdariffa TaxID=183260 RepID=A0ABR2EK17_9ROSI
MEMSSRDRTTESRKWKEREISPGRHKIWMKPKSCNAHAHAHAQRKVSVVYYLSRNGQLQHPHFMQLPLSSSNHGLYLKGSEILDHSIGTHSLPVKSSFFRLTKPSDGQKSDNDCDLLSVRRRRNHSWSSIDLHEYRVYKASSIVDSARGLAADASTQIDDKRRRGSMVKLKQTETEEVENEGQELEQNPTWELNMEEISPPPSDSSPETLESLMKADGRLRLCNKENLNRSGEGSQSGRTKVSSVLMQLISCGSISFKDCGARSERDQGFSLIGHYKSRIPRGKEGGSFSRLGLEDKECFSGSFSRLGLEDKECSSGSFSRLGLEDKECFSGSFSLIETNKLELPSLKRSSSYNADRTSQLQLQLQLVEKEIYRARSKCIPRKSKTVAAKKQGILRGGYPLRKWKQ